MNPKSFFHDSDSQKHIVFLSEYLYNVKLQTKIITIIISIPYL